MADFAIDYCGSFLFPILMPFSLHFSPSTYGTLIFECGRRFQLRFECKFENSIQRRSMKWKNSFLKSDILEIKVYCSFHVFNNIITFFPVIPSLFLILQLFLLLPLFLCRRKTSVRCTPPLSHSLWRKPSWTSQVDSVPLEGAAVLFCSSLDWFSLFIVFLSDFSLHCFIKWNDFIYFSTFYESILSYELNHSLSPVLLLSCTLWKPNLNRSERKRECVFVWSSKIRYWILRVREESRS